MATTIAGNPPLLTTRVSMDATPGNVEAVTLPSWARKITIQFKTSDDSTDEAGKIASSGTDGVAIGNDWFQVASGSALELVPSAGRARDDDGHVVYLAGASASGYAHLIVEG